MRFLLSVLALLVSLSVNSQVLKKKNLGVYHGEIVSYSLKMGEEILQVGQTTVSVEFKTDGTMIETIDAKEKKGTYRILNEDKYAIYLEAKLDGQYIPENYVLYKKDKRLERKGIYPQPDTFLKKQ